MSKMMKVAEVQFVPWDKAYYFSYEGLNVKVNDKVIVRTEIGMEMGEIINFKEVKESDFVKVEINEEGEEADIVQADAETNDKKTSLKPILRRAGAADLEKITTTASKKKALDYVKQTKEKYKLAMKFIDVYFAFDASRITFAFIADGRVDFRDMVKDLTRHFGKTIRLQQIGIRDEAKIMGDFGHCGRGLCCRGHLRNLESITSEMAEIQQCSHRGSERISGICGRLMCCLAYEQGGYAELADKLPPIGAKVSVDGKRGVVASHHTLKQSVDVEFPGENGDRGTIVEVDLNRKKKDRE
ncbi:stage 0 sporulation protein [Candidatus Parcubacteria bacterium]|nr:stage 0 sporulation protein [Candidatus Parcubacteria bacterium]